MPPVSPSRLLGKHLASCRIAVHCIQNFVLPSIFETNETPLLLTSWKTSPSSETWDLTWDDQQINSLLIERWALAFRYKASRKIPPVNGCVKQAWRISGNACLGDEMWRQCLTLCRRKAKWRQSDGKVRQGKARMHVCCMRKVSLSCCALISPAWRRAKALSTDLQGASPRRCKKKVEKEVHSK